MRDYGYIAFDICWSIYFDLITYFSVYLGIDSPINETISTSGMFSELSSVRVEQSRLSLQYKKCQ